MGLLLVNSTGECLGNSTSAAWHLDKSRRGVWRFTLRAVLECFLSWIKYTNLQASDAWQHGMSECGGVPLQSPVFPGLSPQTGVKSASPNAQLPKQERSALRGDYDTIAMNVPVSLPMVLAPGLPSPCRPGCPCRHGFPRPSHQDIAQNPLIPECFKHVVEGGDLSETATDIVVELLRMCAPDISVYQPVIQVLKWERFGGGCWGGGVEPTVVDHQLVYSG
eukprot:Skav211443  [mRNA]  locus=scaffold1591:293449:295243:- [translate_table: standard]